MGYTDDLARLKQYRAAEARNEINRELVDYEQSYIEAEERAAEAVARGDADLADAYLNESDTQRRHWEDAQQRLARVQQDLPPENPLSEYKQAWILQRADLAAQPGMDQVAAFADAYITRNMGVTPDTDTYFELMSIACEPQGYEPQITPDEVCERLGIDADTYNENLIKMLKAKQSGSYPDK